MKYRILCLLLLASLLCTLVACGEEAPTIASTEQTEEAAVPMATQAPRTAITDVPAGMFGTITDGLYQNSLLGIEYRLRDEWYFLSDTDKAKANGVVDTGLTNAALTDAVKNSGFYYDMSAFTESNNYRVSVTFEHTAYLYGANLTEQEYAEKMLGKVNGRLSGIDVSVISAELGTTWLVGEEHPCLWLVFFENGETRYQTQVYVQADAFMATITATSTKQGKSGDFIDRFDSYTPVAPTTSEESD